MKKFLFLGAMAAMLLGTASCSNDTEPVANGDEALVQYTVMLGDGIDSRTISDGTGANTLKFAVFTEDGQHLRDLDQTVPVENKTATITTKLARYHTYKLVFWAQNSACTAYNTDDMSAITVNYTANCNDETRDAFYKMYVQEMGNTPVNETIVLTRPFAQINFLADDAAGVVGVDAYKSKVTVTGVPTTLNTLEGTVGTETTDVTFDYATIINSQEKLEGYEDYRYVAMNYILAATDKEMKNEVVLTVNDGSAEGSAADVNTVTVANCPVQRNYRTNIFGSLFTVEGNFNITIDPIYNTPDYEIDPEATVFNVTNKDEFDAALASDAKKIIINLGEGEFEYKAQHAVHIKYGGDNTQSITIIGAGTDKTLIKGVTTYRSQITTNNPDCVVTFKNMSVTSIHVDANGVEDQRFAATWDGYDYAICCNFVAENVKFLKSVSICNSKTVLLKNTIIEEHKAYGLNGSGQMVNFDSYALWIEAGTNVTLDGCTIDAKATNGKQNRGIKISDEYITSDLQIAYLKVKDCIFKSDKKAAILVGTKAGANITVEGIDITGVTADPDHAVWIDGDYTQYGNLVTVTGAACIDEP